MAKANKPTAKTAMADLKNQKHTIPKSDAEKMVKKYKKVRQKLAELNEEQDLKLPAFPVSVTFNRKAMEDLLALNGCFAARIYPAVTKTNEVTFVLVGVDKDGENIYGSTGTSEESSPADAGTVTDEGQMSPPYPAPSNGL